jgi:hypothetical protein
MMKYAKVTVGKHLSSEYRLNKCLRQGDSVAPLLFNVVQEIAIRRSKVETLGIICDKCSQIMAYADEVVILGRLQDSKEVSITLVKPINKVGLRNEGGGRQNLWRYHESHTMKMNSKTWYI